VPSPQRRSSRSTADDGAPTVTADDPAGDPADHTPAKAKAKDTAKGTGKDGDEDPAAQAADAESTTQTSAKPARSRRSLPRVAIQISPTAVVAALLVVLVGVGTWLFLTRPTGPGASPIELTAFDEILSAARSGVVDVTSFDYLTLDQDLAEIDAVTTGDLRDEVRETLESRREQLITDQQVSSTEVIAASLTEASPGQATALIVLRARQKSLLTPQETVTRYRVEVILEFVDGRWLLSGLTGR